MGAGFNYTCSKRQTKLNLNLPSATALTEQMQSYFSEIEDPRVQRTRSHLLTDLLIIGILSVIAGGKE